METKSDFKSEVNHHVVVSCYRKAVLKLISGVAILEVSRERMILMIIVLVEKPFNMKILSSIK